MINMNFKMKTILSNKNSNTIDENIIKKMCYNIVSKTKIIKNNECIVYDAKDQINDTNLNWEYILKINNDLTGFEVSCNEILLDSYINYNSNNLKNIIICTLKYFEEQLQKMYCNKHFCIIIHYNNKNLILRFHTYRIREGLWVDECLENYEEAILYEII